MLRLSLARQFSAIAAFALFAFLFVAATAMARDTTASPAIWKIDGEKSDIYFFGSFHILPKDLVWRTPALEAALNAAQQIVFEVDFDQAQDASVMGDLVARYGFLPPDKSLRRMIAVEYRAKLEATAAELGLPIASVDRMRPWLAALTITSLTAIKQTSRSGTKPDPAAGMSEQGGVDLKLWNWAKQNTKPRGALETVESQIQVFANLTPEQEVQYLVMILQQGAKVEESIDQLLQAWKTGNIQELDRALNGDMDSFPAMRKALFDDRHAKWMPQIEAMLNDGRNHVIVVGAAHLVGKGSIIDLLRAKGVRVEGPEYIRSGIREASPNRLSYVPPWSGQDSAMQSKEYILGSHDTEIARLLLQHRVWRPRMLDSWRRAGITTGQTIVDLGCGPGYASTDLAEIVGPRGHVLAIDRSPRFLQRLQRQCDAFGVMNVETREADVTAIDLKGIDAHALWCRWVFSWLPNPAQAIATIRDSLRPGGVAIFHEYLNYSTWKLVPASPAFEKFVTAVINSTARTGANIDSAAFLPSLLEANDMEILALNPIMDVVGPHNFVWQWPAAFMREFAPTLVRNGDLTPEDEIRAIEALASAEKSEVVRMVTPVVLEIIARRQ